MAILGGFLVGVGAAFGTGCVIGNIISGLGLMSVGLLLFAATTLLANWVTTYFYLMGGNGETGRTRLAFNFGGGDNVAHVQL